MGIKGNSLDFRRACCLSTTPASQLSAAQATHTCYNDKQMSAPWRPAMAKGDHSTVPREVSPLTGGSDAGALWDEKRAN